MKPIGLKKYGLLLLIILYSKGLYAQDFQPFLIEYFPPSEISHPANDFQNNLKIETIRLSIGEVLPTIYSTERSQIFYGIRYDLFYNAFENWNIIPKEPRYLHFIRNEFTLVQDISDHWRVTGLINFGLATDLKKKISWDDGHIHSYLYFSNMASSDLCYGIGAIYTSDFGSPIFLPLLYGYWQPIKQLRFEAFLPKNASFWFIPDNNIELGIRSMVNGNRFHLAEYTPQKKDTYLHYSVISIGPSFKLRLFNRYFLLFEAGYTLHRRFEIKDGGFSEKLNPVNKYYLRTGLIFRSSREVPK